MAHVSSNASTGGIGHEAPANNLHGRARTTAGLSASTVMPLSSKSSSRSAKSVRDKLSLSENQLQEQVVQYLKAVLIQPAMVFHIPNQGKGRQSKWARMHLFGPMGAVAGMPDLMIIQKGRVCAIELKTDSGTVSKSQKAAMARLNAAGCPAVECRSIDDVREHLKLAGFETREAA